MLAGDPRAIAELRALATPAGIQVVNLSRGVEEDASFATLAARQALDALEQTAWGRYRPPAGSPRGSSSSSDQGDGVVALEGRGIRLLRRVEVAREFHGKSAERFEQPSEYFLELM